MAVVSAVEKVVTAEHHQMALNSGLEESAHAHSTILQTPLAQKVTATTAGTQTFARVSAHPAPRPCAEENSKSDAKITAVATAEATVHASS